MKLKKLFAVMLTLILLLSIVSTGLIASAIMMVETQYTYDSPNQSWLKDLIVKEDMKSVDGLSQRNTLVAKPQYPYTDTAESFREEVSYYQVLYTLDEDMANVIYIYMLELAMSFANVSDTHYSDEFIRSYLENIGIVYPEEDADSEETRIVARAFFSIITKDEGYTVKKGTGLFEAFTAYISTLFGVNIDSIVKFDSNSDLTDLKDYGVAACKYMLYNLGYDVNKDTPDSEVYRLIAIMTIRSQGITIDSGTATFEEIKTKYLCALMCKVYDVSIDTKGFENALNDGDLAFYMLQLIGKKYGITIKNSLSYETAFETVCKNTPYFNLEEGEFYADIYEYDISLNYKRDTVWIYPQTLGTTDESTGTTVNVFINGADVRENYYVDVAIDKNEAIIPVLITVEYKDSKGSVTSTSYKLNIIQGKNEAIKNNTVSEVFDGFTDVVQQVLKDMGMESPLAGIIQNIPFKLPDRILSISTLLLPKLDGNSLGLGFLSQLFGYSKDDDSNVNTEQIGGIGGLDSFNQSADSSQSMDFGQLQPGQLNTGSTQIAPGQINTGNIQFNSGVSEMTTNPANTLIIPDENGYSGSGTAVEKENWFVELMSDPMTVIVLIVMLVLTFGICLFLFTKLLNGKGTKKSDDGKKKTKKNKKTKS